MTDSHRRSLIIFALLVACLTPRTVGADEYGYDLKRRHPAAFRAWHKIVPARYRRVKWLYDLDGTAVPVQRVTLGKRVFLTATVCEPHDCGDNIVAFLVAERGGVAYGLLHSANQAPDGDVVFGTPGNDERRLLDQALGTGE